MQKKRWTEEEISLLRRDWGKVPSTEIMLPDRTS